MSKNTGSVAPKERVNIRYVPATSDEQAEVELPHKMLVLGDFGLDDSRALEDRQVNRSRASITTKTSPGSTTTTCGAILLFCSGTAPRRQPATRRSVLPHQRFGTGGASAAAVP